MQDNIIQKIKSGDLRELDKVYLAIKPKFIAYAHRQFATIPLEEVEDIYQDTIIVF
jgi:DNA-directed RNA polymerase specialized sigma24 family protein